MIKPTVPTLLSLCATCLFAFNTVRAQDTDPFAANVRPTDPLSPEEEQASFTLPPGFAIQLFAAEPDIMKPMNMAFDARGRLWVTDTREYPYPVPPDQPGRDSVKILEDTDGDGRADKVTTFADGLNIPIGLYPYHGGAVVFSIPHIWHMRDTDGDDQADERRVLFGPMGWERDTHGLNNAFRRGFDGWLYACHGFNNETTVSSPDGNVVRMQSGNTYRMRLDGSRIEHFTHGQVNPFGMTMDPLGNLFTADCHSKPIYQLLRGGYYPSFGKPHDGLGFVPPMMDHLHGSTAIAGIAFCTGTAFPPEYRGNVFTGNVMTSRVNRDTLHYHGSTILAQEEPDFLSTTDPWFRPVDVRFGPDGALYIADFYNRIIGHYEVPLDHPGRDRLRGRIWRVTYTGDGTDGVATPFMKDLTQAVTSELIATLKHPQLEVRLLAADQLVDRIGRAAAAEVATAWRESNDVSLRVHGLWVLHRLGALTAEITNEALRSDERDLRVHALKSLAETRNWADEDFDRVCALLGDEDAFVSRAAADALGLHLRDASVGPLVARLAEIPEEDKLLRHTVRMAIRNHLRAEPLLRAWSDRELEPEVRGEIAEICLAISTPAAGTFLLDYAASGAVEGMQLVSYLQHAARTVSPDDTARLAKLVQSRFANNVDFQRELFSGVTAGIRQRGDSLSADVRQWGATLARKLLGSIGPAEDSWRSEPLPGAFPGIPWVLQRRTSSDGIDDEPFFSSLPRGERLTGVLRSASFSVPNRLSFFIAGHNGFPGRGPLVVKNLVRLRDAETHDVLREATPPRNDVAQPVTWELEELRGRRAYLEIVDGDAANAYAWLAVGRFEPEIVPMPTADPVRVAERRQAAARIATELQLREFAPQFEVLLTEGRGTPETQQAAAEALAEFQKEPLAGSLASLLGHAALPPAARGAICSAIVNPQDDALDLACREIVKTAPQAVQEALALSLAGSRSGASLLLRLVEARHASPRLLLSPAVKQRLSASGLPELDSRIEKLTAGLPSESEEIRKLVAIRRLEFAVKDKSVEAGAAVFKKSCAACHQLDGEGPLIGPQLDGIGNRGVDRLIEDVLDPNRNVDLAFQTSTITTIDGKVLTGLFRREEGAVQVFVDSQGKEFSVPAAEIDEHVKSPLSLMPENMGTTLSADDFRHLMAFLLSKKAQPKHP